MCPVVHVPHWPCSPSPMCPITYVPHPSRCLISIFSINHDTNLPTFPIAHMSKKMSSCQKDVKLSKEVACKKVKHIDYGGGSQKKKIDIMRFTHIDVNFDVTYDGDQKSLKCA